MARRRNPPQAVRAKWLLADRLRTIRTELYGERSLAEFARRIGVPVRTWYSYETGVTVPAEILLQFVDLTQLEPLWLLHGRGPQFLTDAASTFDPGLPMPHRDVEREAADLPAMAPAEGSQPGSSRRSAFGTETSSGTATATLERPRASTSTDLVQTLFGRERSPGRPRCRCVRIEGVAMTPIVADGAFVAFAETEEDPDALDGKLVVVQIDGSPIVRWLFRSGDFALLRAENPAFEPSTQLIDLRGPTADLGIRRVLWVGTGH
jgi:hypothetical protein